MRDLLGAQKLARSACWADGNQSFDREFRGRRRKASMKTTISVIKADVGSIGGHIKPSAKLKAAIEQHVRDKGKKLLIDLYVSSTGDDTALLMSHDRGVNDPKIHELAWDAFMAGTKVAKEQGLYGAGQDLLKDAFSGNVRGLGPAS